MGSFLANQPVGTIMPFVAAPGQQSGYMVRGQTDWYHCQPDPDHPPMMRCTCKSYHFQGHCKHLEWLADDLWEKAQCPACHGRCHLLPRATYFHGDGSLDQEPAPCLLCDGSGRRADCDRELLERFLNRHQRADDLPSDAELREVFR